MLTKAFKKLWLAALKGGNYKKGEGALRRGRDNECCCLGVAGDLLVAQGKAKWLSQGYHQWDLTALESYDQSGAFLPSTLLDMVGLSDGEQRQLARINDHSSSFGPVIYAITRLPTRG